MVRGRAFSHFMYALPDATMSARQHCSLSTASRVPLEVTMERYAHRENIALYQRLLTETNVTKDHVRQPCCWSYWLPN